MSIRKGSALKESAKAVITETKFTKKDLATDRLLLLEGPDDVEVIRNFYLYKGSEVKRVFRLIKANEEEIEESNKIAGKQNALQLFKKLKSQNRNVICLLDRDFDFYLNETHRDPRVIYYDYYELENYIFEDSIFRVILKNVCDYSEFSIYEELVLLLHDIEKACKPYILLCFLREVNYRKNVLTEDQLNKVLEIIKVKPVSMMEMKHLGIDNKLERISRYIEIELKKVGLSIESVRQIIDENGYDANKIMENTEPLYLFKYAIKGKMVSNSLSYFFKYILETNPHLNEIKSKGDLSRILPRLKIEWIPNFSKKFSELMNLIENKYVKDEVSQK
ncbi:MAG TPA: DUF4435 domain-containing protein [Anoxybacillus sp.]|nr:DUF4435 domain-containing protein [Anoxybacillus sp.]